MRAKDIMSDGVISVTADATVFEAAVILVNNRVSAMPVLDDRGFMIGIVSEADLMQRSEIGLNPDAPGLLRRFADDLQAAEAFVHANSRRVIDVMSKNVVTAREDATLAEVVELMAEHHIKRVPILRGRTVVGIVSRADVLQALISRVPVPSLVAAPAPAEGSPASDEQLRRDVVAAMQGHSWSLARRTDVIVQGGAVHLWGVVPSEMVRRAYVVAAEKVPGVRTVESHMHVARAVAPLEY